MTRLIERGPFLLATALAAAMWAEPAAAVRSSAPAARSSFDGAWSVVIITDSGTCDRQYRYGLQISNGRVVYQGDPSINIAGRVDPNGRVAVVVRSGDQVASGAGRLSGRRCMIDSSEIFSSAMRRAMVAAVPGRSTAASRI